MGNWPKISVVTVCFNAGGTIEKTIKSVISQNYPNLEYLIIDGGSKDDTLVVIDRYKEYINYFDSEKDSGIYHAMNKGLKNATGDWVVFLNADDMFTNEALLKVGQAINEHPNVDAVIGGAYIIEKAQNTFRVKTLYPVINVDTVFYGQPFCHQALILKKDTYDRLGPFDIKYHIVADHEYTMRLFKNNFTFHILMEPIVVFLATGISSTNQFRSTLESANCLRTYGFTRARVLKIFLKRHLKTFAYKFLRLAHLHFFINLWYKKADKMGLRKGSPQYDYLSDSEAQQLLKKYNVELR